MAVTFVDWRDMHRWKLINDALDLGRPEPEETYSTSEHLYTQLDIPREATGTLPRAMRERVGLEAEAIEDIGETGKIRTPKRGRGRPSFRTRQRRARRHRRQHGPWRQPAAEEHAGRRRRGRSCGRRPGPAAAPDQGRP